MSRITYLRSLIHQLEDDDLIKLDVYRNRTNEEGTFRVSVRELRGHSSTVIEGHPPKKPEPQNDEVEIRCWKCRHAWNAPFSWNLVFYGYIDCPKCKTTNEIGG